MTAPETRTLFGPPSDPDDPVAGLLPDEGPWSPFESVVVLRSAETPFSMILSLNAKSMGSLVETFTGFPFLINGLNSTS